MTMRFAGVAAALLFAVFGVAGCGTSGGDGGGSGGAAWERAARDRGEAARIAGDIRKLPREQAAKVEQTLEAMAATPRGPAGLRAAAALADGARVVPADWAGGGGTHPAARALHDASIDLLAGLVAAAAAAAKKDAAAREDLAEAVAEIPLPHLYNSGGPISDAQDRSRLEGELRLAFGKDYVPPARPDDPTPDLGSGSGSGPGTVGACVPVEPHQRAAKATVELTGERTHASITVPALCGAFHTAATNRFKPGDGTLFRACLDDGQVLSISADVLLVGKVKPLFTYADYKKTGPLVELQVAGVGTYNQRDEPADTDTLDIAFDWSKVSLSIDLVWPSKTDRVVHATAAWDCGGPMRANTWGP